MEPTFNPPPPPLPRVLLAQDRATSQPGRRGHPAQHGVVHGPNHSHSNVVPPAPQQPSPGMNQAFPVPMHYSHAPQQVLYNKTPAVCPPEPNQPGSAAGAAAAAAAAAAAMAERKPPTPTHSQTVHVTAAAAGATRAASARGMLVPSQLQLLQRHLPQNVSHTQKLQRASGILRGAPPSQQPPASVAQPVPPQQAPMQATSSCVRGTRQQAQTPSTATLVGGQVTAATAATLLPSASPSQVVHSTLVAHAGPAQRQQSAQQQQRQAQPQRPQPPRQTAGGRGGAPIRPLQLASGRPVTLVYTQGPTSQGPATLEGEGGGNSAPLLQASTGTGDAGSSRGGGWNGRGGGRSHGHNYHPSLYTSEDWKQAWPGSQAIKHVSTGECV